MEKRIPFVQFQSVKSIAKAIDPSLRQKARLEAQIAGLEEEFKAKEAEEIGKLKARIALNKEVKTKKLYTELQETDNEIATIEAGIVSIIGFHVTDLVKKIIEPNAKGVKETKYIPTDIVSYDNATKEYIITVPDEKEAHEEPSTEEDISSESSEENTDAEPVIPPTTEEAGSDYDKDAETTEIIEEAKEDGLNQLPWN